MDFNKTKCITLSGYPSCLCQSRSVQKFACCRKSPLMRNVFAAILLVQLTLVVHLARLHKLKKNPSVPSASQRPRNDSRVDLRRKIITIIIMKEVIHASIHLVTPLNMLHCASHFPRFGTTLLTGERDLPLLLLCRNALHQNQTPAWLEQTQTKRVNKVP